MLKNIYSGLAAKESSPKADFFWNFIGSFVNSAASVVLLMVVNRVNGQEIGGVFSVGFTISQLMFVIGSFETITYQVTDSKNQFSFNNYFGFKIVTCGIMIVACIVDVIRRDFDSFKLTITLLLCLLRLLDAFSTLYFGTLQKEGRLNLAGFSYFARQLFSYGTMVLMLIMTKSLVLSILSSCIISLSWILFFENPLTANFEKMKPSFEFRKIKELFFDCFPLFASVFVLMYLNNSPKYAVDAVLGNVSVNIFSILFMPAFVINLLSLFIFKPLLKDLSEAWHYNSDKRKFVKITYMILGVVVISTVLAMIIGYLFGIPVLSWFFGIDLSEYRYTLMLVIIAGGFSAIGSALYNVIAVMRKQKILLIGYIIAMLISFFTSKQLVIELGLNGAGVSFLISMFLTSVMFFVTFLFFVKKKNNTNKEFLNE